MDTGRRTQEPIAEETAGGRAQQDFYSGLYRQYTTNLLKLVIYVRSLIGNQAVKEYLLANHGELVGIFEQILEHTEGG